MKVWKMLTPGRYVGIDEQEDAGKPFGQQMTRLNPVLSEMSGKSHEPEEELHRKLEAIRYEI